MNHAFFNRLNYTLANEDSRLERAVLPENVGHVLAVAGSGARVVPLLSRRPHRLTCVDAADEQLWITEIRIAALRAFGHGEYLRFWGYPPESASPEERLDLFERLELSGPARRFGRELFEAAGWESVLYRGQWERTFARLAHVNRRLTGPAGARLFECRTLSEQSTYLAGGFPRLAWKAVLFLVGNKAVFNTLLYNGEFPKKNTPGSHVRFYSERFDRLFRQGPARENFFLQLAFFGRILYPEGLPAEAEKSTFKLAREGARNCEIRYVRGNVLREAATIDTPADFVSLSDVASYYHGREAEEFMSDLSRGLSPGATVVVRCYLHIPEGARSADRHGYERLTERYEDAIAAERVGVYDVEVWQWRGEGAT